MDRRGINMAVFCMATRWYGLVDNAVGLPIVVRVRHHYNDNCPRCDSEKTIGAAGVIDRRPARYPLRSRPHCIDAGRRIATVTSVFMTKREGSNQQFDPKAEQQQQLPTDTTELQALDDKSTQKADFLQLQLRNIEKDNGSKDPSLPPSKSFQDKVDDFLDRPFFDPAKFDDSDDSFLGKFARLVKSDYELAETLYVGCLFVVLIIVTQEALRMQLYGDSYVPFLRGSSGVLRGGKLF
ncbi:hypothetical protein IV203_030209 [Nitzschia inconspicua]|uniref:Uncharacterized protein n=1 Tax=Nitzschia inconspicua TaxID=303405 RepID=A0A9K3LS53_9STRA|nr:hypothetical protein IV203_030209 [Nitzschia inconspicua]